MGRFVALIQGRGDGGSDQGSSSRDSEKQSDSGGKYTHKKVQNLHENNFKTLLKNTKEHFNNGNITCPRMGRLNIIQMIVLH